MSSSVRHRSCSRYLNVTHDNATELFKPRTTTNVFSEIGTASYTLRELLCGLGNAKARISSGRSLIAMRATDDRSTPGCAKTWPNTAMLPSHKSQAQACAVIGNLVGRGAAICSNLSLSVKTSVFARLMFVITFRVDVGNADTPILSGKPMKSFVETMCPCGFT